MRKVLYLAAALLWAMPALADTTIPNLGAAGAAAGADLVPTSQSGGTATKQTLTVISNLFWSLASGDCTIASGGGITCTKTSGVAFAASATTNALNATNINAGTLAAARLPSPTASTLGGIESLAAVSHNWINTISTSGVPSATQPACADISDAVAGCNTALNLTSTTPNIVVGGTATAPTLTSAAVFNAQTGTSYTVVTGDNTKIVTLSNGSAVAVTLPQAGSAGFLSNWSACFVNLGAGTVTITTTTSLINGSGSTATLPQGASACLASNGTDWSGVIAPPKPTGTATNFLNGSWGYTAPPGTGITNLAMGAGIASTNVGGQGAITTTGTVFADASYFPFFLGGLTLSNDGGTPNTVIDVAAGAAASDDNTTMMKLAAITKTTGGTWVVGTGNAGLDAGSIAASTWYHVFVIERTDTGVVDALISTSATAPTLPTNYTKKRRIGSFKTNGSSNIIAFVQRGNVFWWKVAVLDVTTSTLSTSQVLETLGSVPTGIVVQPICRYAIANAGNSVILLSPDVTDVAPGTATPFTTAPGWDQLDTTLTAGDQNSTCPFITTNTSAQIGARASAASTSLDIVTQGWID